MEDLSKIDIFPHFHNFTANSNTTRIALPSDCRKISIGSEEKKLYVCRNGATDDGALPAHYQFIPKDNMLPINMGVGKTVDFNIYVASSSGSAKVHIILMEE